MCVGSAYGASVGVGSVGIVHNLRESSAWS